MNTNRSGKSQSKKRKSSSKSVNSPAIVMEPEANLDDGYDNIPVMSSKDLGLDPNKPTKSRKDTGNYEYESSTEEEEDGSGLFGVPLATSTKKVEGLTPE